MTPHQNNAALADDVIQLYERHAYDWAAARRSDGSMEQGWLDRFGSLLTAGGSILDLGCGFGEPIARCFIDSGFQVTGVDSSPTMISLCRARFPNGEWLTADMRSLSLGRRFDGVLAWDSFFHLKPDDQRRMFAVFASHAAPDAALMFTSGPAFGEVIGVLEGDALYHASLDAQEYRSLLSTHGFSVVAHTVDDATCSGHTIWLAQHIHG